MVARLTAAGAVWALSLGIAAAAPGGVPAAGEEASPQRVQAAPSFDDLSEAFSAADTVAAGDPAFDLPVRIEAEEIAEVAEELFAEGDAALAVDLLHEAVALLTPEPE